ncbi:MAG TPA: tRNA guanosine(34) transglycosylase Tgt [Candidatus Binatia bacterium]|nr:tRNA guanosine(34) transglycosylase Tgt [Candidatus Binatia bacterium]
MNERPFRFELLRRDGEGRARRGRIVTERGTVETPAFMPVATVGAVKGITPQELRSLGAEIVLANAYHLSLRPGADVVRELGGLAKFMGWDGPVLTDSGGFQVFSLAELVHLDEEGVRIRSHLDGSLQDLTPARVVEIQEALGVDVLMPLDDCAPYPSELRRVEESVARTAHWLARSRAAWKSSGALFGIVQGGVFESLRARSAGLAVDLDLPGYAVGGLSVGEPRPLFYEVAAATADRLPVERPRYLMGAGTPEDLVRLVSMGYDLFDCVLPTRNGRNGTLFTSRGRLNIRNARFARDPAPVDPRCDCPVCTRFSRAYLRHLAIAGEILSPMLNTVHNLAFYLRLLGDMRRALEQGTFPEYTSRILVDLSRGGQEGE